MKLTKEQDIFLETHPFQVFKLKLNKINFLLLNGNVDEKGNSKYAANYFTAKDLSYRLEELQETYKEYSKTDGSKVNWLPKELRFPPIKENGNTN